ncbi:MAG: hypothetical protein Q9174_006914 [Haloplaca sp. 1 TL-2023]
MTDTRNRSPHVPRSPTTALLNSYLAKRSGVRKTRLKKPLRLPQFDRPYRKHVDGVPALVLQLLPGLVSEEEIPVDVESDCSATDDNDHPPGKAKPRRDPYDQKIDVFPPNTKIEGILRPSLAKEGNEPLHKFVAGPIGKTYNGDSAKHAGGWVGKKPLGRGGYGIAGLWERVDENGVTHQIAVKQVADSRWDPAPPREVTVMKAIKRWSKKYGEKDTGCVEFKKYIRYPSRKVHRIYMVHFPPFAFNDQPSTHIPTRNIALMATFGGSGSSVSPMGVTSPNSSFGTSSTTSHSPAARFHKSPRAAENPAGNSSTRT